MQALLDIMAAIVVWAASLALSQLGIDADFLRPGAHQPPAAHASPQTVGEPRETPASEPCPDAEKARIHGV